MPLAGERMSASVIGIDESRSGRPTIGLCQSTEKLT
jgi:hypothetical protein